MTREFQTLPMTPATVHSPGLLAQLACVLEATARKPGNVHRFTDFEDCTYLDFVAGAAAIAGPLDRARTVGVGRAVLDAVEATRRLVTSNTNLGMILLLAPLAAVAEGADLRAGLGAILAGLTIDDAHHAYRAIRLAQPGGLGASTEQDVADEPTVTLLDAMRIAADRDAVARQYATGYEDVFAIALPALGAALRAGLPTEASILVAHLTLMARRPDTLIARKRGWAIAEESARRADAVLAAGWPVAPGSVAAIRELDAWLRAEGHARNPGATADLVAATLYVALREGTIQWPRHLAGDRWDASRAL